MILQQNTGLEINSDINSIQAGISNENMSIVFDMMSKNLYSRPLPSLIREISSNMIDSCTDAKNTNSCIIELKHDKEDNSKYLSFQDFGTGLSPDSMINTYMNYFSSTKRNDNTTLGQFGIGSKSPLSYQDSFYINTVYNNKEYNYIYSRGINKPELISLHGYTEQSKQIIYIDDNGIERFKTEIVKVPIGIMTSKCNGTEIKVLIKEEDIGYTLNIALYNELYYFDNIHFKNLSNLDNNYQIYELDTFKLRNVQNESLTLNKELHIILGQVTYPIDWKVLGIPKIDTRVGLKFNIGELQVTPNRESIRYIDGTKELILNKIEQFKNEVFNIFVKNHQQVDNVWDLIKKNDTNMIGIKIEDTSIYVNKNIFNEKLVFYHKDYPDLKVNNTNIFNYLYEGVEAKDKRKLNFYNIVHNNYVLVDCKKTKFNKLKIYHHIFIKSKCFDKPDSYSDCLRYLELNSETFTEELFNKQIAFIRQDFERYVTRYSDYLMSNEEIKELKSENKVIVTKDKTVVTLKLFNDYNTISRTVEDLKSYSHLIYFFKEQKSQNLTKLLNVVLKANINKKKNRVLLFEITKSEHNKIKNLLNLHALDDCYKLDLFKRLADKIYTYKFYEQTNIRQFLQKISCCSDYYSNIETEIRNYFKSIFDYTNVEINNFNLKSNFVPDNLIVNKIKEIQKLKNSINQECYSYIRVNYNHNDYILKLVLSKSKILKLNNKFLTSKLKQND